MNRTLLTIYHPSLRDGYQTNLDPVRLEVNRKGPHRRRVFRHHLLADAYALDLEALARDGARFRLVTYRPDSPCVEEYVSLTELRTRFPA